MTMDVMQYQATALLMSPLKNENQGLSHPVSTFITENTVIPACF